MYKVKKIYIKNFGTFGKWELLRGNVFFKSKKRKMEKIQNKNINKVFICVSNGNLKKPFKK